MIFPQMLHPELVGRSPVKRTELRYRTNVSLMGARRQIAHRHVVDHALAQRRDRLGHRWTPVYWTAQRAILSDRVFSCDGHPPLRQPLARVREKFCDISRMAPLSH